MLPPETQHLIYNVIPRQLTIDWRQPTSGPDPDVPKQASVNLTVREQRQDEPPLSQYPLAAVTFDPTSIIFGRNRPLKDIIHETVVPNDPNIALKRWVGQDMYDVLNIIIAVADGKDGIPKSVLAQKIASEVYASFLLGADHLNDVAQMTEPYEWPVLIEQSRDVGISRMPTIQNATAITRYQMEFRCRYTLTEEMFIDAVDAIGYTIETRTEGEATTNITTGEVDLPPDFGDPDLT